MYTDLVQRPENRSAGRESAAALGLSLVILAFPPALVALIAWLVLGATLWWRWPLAVLLTLILWCLVPRGAKVPQDVVVVERDRLPHLWAMIDQLANGMGVPAPEILALDADLNASVRHIGWRRRRLMVIGIPLWDALEPQQRVYVLGHELGHLLHGDTARGRIVGSAFHVLARMVGVLWPSWMDTYGYGRGAHLGDSLANGIRRVLAMPFLLTLFALRRLDLRAGQRAEFLADLAAARLSGGPAARAGAERLMGLHGHWLRAASAARRGEDAWAELARWVEPSERELRRRLRASELTVGAFDGTHPPDHLRAALVQTLSPQAAALVVPESQTRLIEAEIEPVRRELTAELRYLLKNSR
jgi:Zn-dependent protease with chaperone function